MDNGHLAEYVTNIEGSGSDRGSSVARDRLKQDRRGLHPRFLRLFADEEAILGVGDHYGWKVSAPVGDA